MIAIIRIKMKIFVNLYLTIKFDSSRTSYPKDIEKSSDEYRHKGLVYIALRNSVSDEIQVESVIEIKVAPD